MQILDVLGMYFDAAVVFVMKFSFLFRLALAILSRRQNSDLVNMLNIRIFHIEKHKILAKSIHILPEPNMTLLVVQAV